MNIVFLCKKNIAQSFPISLTFFSYSSEISMNVFDCKSNTENVFIVIPITYEELKTEYYIHIKDKYVKSYGFSVK